VRSFDGYGALSGRSIDQAQTGHRDLFKADTGLNAETRKREVDDFALWKEAKPGEPSWDSPWGPGRPGWHMECSAMSEKYLGLPIDIHGGGIDLVFPHHENERAQAEAAWQCPFVTYWMHGGMLQVNAEKMSKSLSNFKLLRDILVHTKAPVLRMLMVQTHYRSPLEFSDERLNEAEAAFERIVNTLKTLEWLIANATEAATSHLSGQEISRLTRQLRTNFVVAMDDDINAPAALGEIFSFITDINSLVSGVTLGLDDVEVIESVRAIIIELMGVFGITVSAHPEINCPEEVIALAKSLASFQGEDVHVALDVLIQMRALARESKDWDKADAVRNGLFALGIIVKDTAQGTQISYV
jgi:cysteinyl-tRNA synthetase